CCFGRRPRVRYAAPFSYTTLFRSAFDPDEPVFLLPEVAARLAALRRPDTLMADRRARSFIGQAVGGTETELARRKVRVVGTFSRSEEHKTELQSPDHLVCRLPRGR